MATTITIGIRNEQDAFNFLAYDFQNSRGVNNSLYYSRCCTPDGKSITNDYNVALNSAANQGYVDTVTNTDTRIIMNGAQTDNGQIVSVNASGRLSLAYVFMLTEDSSLGERQNRLWDDTQRWNSGYEYSATNPADIRFDIKSSQLHPGSIFFGDTPARRALWNGSGNSFSGTDRTSIFGLIRTGLRVPRFGGNNIRYIPGTNLVGTYSETAIPAPVNYTSAYEA